MNKLARYLLAIPFALLSTPSFANAEQIDYVLPDAQYVKSECSRLALEYKDVRTLIGAHHEAAAACSAYNGDGDAWFSAIKAARDEIDGYDPDPNLHDYQTLTPSQVVPRKVNAPYILFLAPDYGWVQQNHSNLTELHGAFENFGKTIGGDGLAIWFTKGGDVASVDTVRSARYAAGTFRFGSHYGLSLNSGPYIVFTGRRPDQWSNADDLVILKLSGLTQRQIIALLNDLQQQLLEGKKPNEGRLLFTEVESRLETLAQLHSKLLQTMVMFIFKGPGALSSGS